jgi:serine/threonine protein kinase
MSPTERPASDAEAPNAAGQGSPAAGGGESRGEPSLGSSGPSSFPALRPDQPTIISSQPLVESGGSSGSPSSIPLVENTGWIGSLVGQTLEHYQLQEFIGGGGMGVVYRALDTRLNRTVALKILARQQSCDAETVRRFRNEAQSAARLDHPNIARVYYVGEDRGLHFIVFEYIDGLNLRNLVAERGPLSVADAIRYTLQLAEALAHASRRDVVHRDIKPSNVLITGEGLVKLVDMGLARLHQLEQSTDLTASGVTLGTFDYISPEQARDPRLADVRSDIYSLGCTLYYMLTGNPPFPDGTMLQKLLQHQEGAPPDPRELNPDVPEGLSRVVRTMLAKEPRKRYQTAEALATELVALAEELEISLPAMAARSAEQRRRSRRAEFVRRHIPWAVPAAVFLLGLLGLHLIGTGSGSLPPPSGEVVIVQPPAQPELAPPATPGQGDAAPVSQPPAAGGTAPVRQPPRVDVAVVEHEPEPRPSPAASTGMQFPEVSGGMRVDAGGASAAGASTLHESASAPRGELAVHDIPPPPAAGPRTLVVDPVKADLAAGEFVNVREAIRAARSDDTIELRFSGRMVAEKPYKLTALNLTIQAAPGHQPVIVFKPPVPDAAQYPHSMISLSDGRLKMVGVALELNLDTTELNTDQIGWALFDLQASSLELRQCWLTIADEAKDHEDVRFIVARPRLRSEAMMMTDAPGTLPLLPVSIALYDCVARGAAVFLESESLQGVQLTWHNGLLAVRESLLLMKGGMQPTAGGEISLVVDRLTAHVAGGLCMLLSDENAQHQLPVRVAAQHSLFVGNGAHPFVTQWGFDLPPPGAGQGRFVWSGGPNAFVNFVTLWEAGDLRQQAENPTRLDLDRWRAIWGAADVSGTLQWASPAGPTGPYSRRVAEQYRLAQPVAGPDAIPLGVDESSLPSVPPEFPVSAVGVSTP